MSGAAVAPLRIVPAEQGSGRTGTVKSRRLFVDVSVIANEDAGTGIQRVVREIWSCLPGGMPPGMVAIPVRAGMRVPYCEARRDFLDHQEPIADCRGVPIEPGAGDIFLGLDLAAGVLVRHRRQLMEWQRRGVAVAVVLYDLLPELHPGWFTRRNRTRYRRWLRMITRRADAVLAISRAVADDYRSWIARPKLFRRYRSPPLASITLGCDFAPRSLRAVGQWAQLSELVTWCQRGRTLLMVGTIEPRKAHQVVLDAMDRVWRTEAGQDVQLLVIGRPGWNTKRLQQRLDALEHAEPRVRWRRSVDDAALRTIYDHAAGLVMASYAEGFGLPIVEAIAAGSRALARDLPVFRELRSDALSFFVDDNAGPLADTIMGWLDHTTPRDVRPLPGWDASVKELVRQLQVLLGLE